MVAGMVLGLSLAIILTDQHWLLFMLCYGFLARVLTGPNLSPMGLMATQVLVPVFGNRQRPVPGPPKRFAQTVGLVFSAVAVVLCFVVGTTTGAKSVVGLLAVFAALEAGVGFCAGMLRVRLSHALGLNPGVGLPGVRGGSGTSHGCIA